MSTDLLTIIALLCNIPNANVAGLEEQQLKCQKYYVACHKRKGGSGYRIYECIEERKP